MTLEESREIIPLMESMIGQIEEQQTLMAEMILEMQNRDTQLSLMQEQNQKLQKLNSELSGLLNILPNTEELLSKMEEQKKEIETIRERKITVKLSDADCDRLARKCGEHGLTIGELIENFVGDLVGGTYSNGSDERDYADQWFERCWFGMFPEPTLLNHLLNFGYEPEHYLDMLENVETIKSDIEITKQNIAEPSDEWKDIVYHKYNDDRTSYECVPCYNSVDEYIASEKEDLESYKADLEEALEELNDMREDWKPEKEPNMDEEIELIKKWVKEREDFINE